MDRAVAIANEFLQRGGAAGLTQMQLQKLVYIAHGWSLALIGGPLTSEEPEAWAYGPVYPDLYDHTKFFGSKPITRLITPHDDEAARFFMGSSKSAAPYRARLSDEERSIIDSVWERYGDVTGSRLSAMTHRPGTPWSETYKDGSGRSRAIDNKLIAGHYRDLAARAA